MARWHALWLKPDLAPEIEREVNVERLRLMAKQQGISAGAHALNSLMLVAAAWPAIDHTLLLAAIVPFQAAAIWQLWLWLRHRHRLRPSAVGDDTLTRICIWSLVFGALWGGLTAGLLTSVQDRETELLICLVVIGMTSGGTMMLFSIPAALAGFLAFSLIPPWLVIVQHPGAMPWTFYAYTTIYAACMLLSARYSYDTFVENVRLRMANADLAYKAEAANRAKSRFLANMSHELRTPLNAIIGFADVMENAVLGPLGTPRYTEYCRDIRESGSNLLSMIDDILDMARLEARRVQLSPKVISAETAITAALAPVDAAAREKAITVSVDVAPGLDLLADPHAIRQILANLLQNAVKFTPAGGRVAVRARRAGACTHLYIEDNGIGIPRSDLARLGRPFTQVERQMTRCHKGSGLGLAITRSMVELHGGALRIRSEESVGTIVLVRLPATRADRADPVVAAVSAKGLREPPRAGRSATGRSAAA